MTLAHDDIGDRDAPPVILVHSLGCDRRMWQAQVDALSPTLPRVAVDIRGHGRSEVPDGDYTLEQLGRDVVDVADALSLETFHYCGLSIGGLIGQWLGLNAARPPPLAHPVQHGRQDQRGRAVERAHRRRPHAGHARLVDAVIERWFTPEFITSHPDDIEQARDWLLETDAGRLCRMLRGDPRRRPPRRGARHHDPHTRRSAAPATSRHHRSSPSSCTSRSRRAS